MGFFCKDPCLKGSLSLSGPFQTMDFRKKWRAAHPFELDRSGIMVFCGPQGSGKTLSAVQYVQKLAKRYPKAIICSNVTIYGLPETTRFVEYDGISSLTDLENGEFGVIYFIDEIHLEFNSLESKSIPIEIFTEISQQRKQRKHIVCTSQLFLRLAKPFREQAKTVIMCRSALGRLLQINDIYNGDTLMEGPDGFSGDRIGVSFWWHSPALYQAYDTYAKIERRYRNEWKNSRLGSRSQSGMLQLYTSDGGSSDK